jgi:hypothetical protein
MLYSDSKVVLCIRFLLLSYGELYSAAPEVVLPNKSNEVPKEDVPGTLNARGHTMQSLL